MPARVCSKLRQTSEIQDPSPARLHHSLALSFCFCLKIIKFSALKLEQLKLVCCKLWRVENRHSLDWTNSTCWTRDGWQSEVNGDSDGSLARLSFSIFITQHFPSVFNSMVYLFSKQIHRDDRKESLWNNCSRDRRWALCTSKSAWRMETLEASGERLDISWQSPCYKQL